MQSQRLSSDLDRQLRCHLSSAVGFYQNLLMRLQRDFSLDFRSTLDLATLPCELGNLSLTFSSPQHIINMLILTPPYHNNAQNHHSYCD